MKKLKAIKEAIKRHRRELEEKFKVKEIGIFGSYMRGEQKKKSDVDILVEFKELPNLLRFIELERYLEEITGCKVDLVRRKAVREELKSTILKEVVMV